MAAESMVENDRNEGGREGTGELPIRVVELCIGVVMGREAGVSTADGDVITNTLGSGGIPFPLLDIPELGGGGQRAIITISRFIHTQYNSSLQTIKIRLHTRTEGGPSPRTSTSL